MNAGAGSYLDIPDADFLLKSQRQKPQNEKTKIPRLRKLPKILHQKNPGFGVDIEVPIRIDLYSIFEKVENEKVKR